MVNKKGQAAMEFLTTYGWAFLVIIVAVAGLSYFGVFDFSKYLQTSCVLDGKLECGEAFALTNNSFQIQIKNNLRVPITFIDPGTNDPSGYIIEKSSNGLPDTCGLMCIEIDDYDCWLDQIGSGETKVVTFSVNDADDCGVTNNVGQKKMFNMGIYYNVQGSSIVNTATGTITTVVQE